MTYGDFTEADSWGGRPVARKMGDAVPRGRVVVNGIVCAARTSDVHRTPSYECTLDDGTGQIDVVFLGRRRVAGVVVGARCTVEGTVRKEGDRLVVWNPLYCIEVPDQ